MSEPKKFKPKALSRESLDVPVEPHLKVMGPKAEKELHEKALEQHRRYKVFGPRQARRLRLYVPGTAVFFALVGWLFLQGTWRAFGIFGLVGAFLGAAVALLHPREFAACALYLLAALIATYLLDMPMSVCLRFSVLVSLIGVAVGRSEQMKWMDGE